MKQWWMGLLVIAGLGGCALLKSPPEKQLTEVPVQVSDSSGSPVATYTTGHRPLQVRMLGEMPPPPEVAQVEIVAPPAPFPANLNTVYFKFNETELSPEGRDRLAAVAEWLKTNPRARATVDGFCDKPGTVTYNQALSEKRAQVVKNTLTQNGVSSDHVSTVGHGKFPGDERKAVISATILAD